MSDNKRPSESEGKPNESVVRQPPNKKFFSADVSDDAIADAILEGVDRVD